MVRLTRGVVLGVVLFGASCSEDATGRLAESTRPDPYAHPLVAYPATTASDIERRAAKLVAEAVSATQTSAPADPPPEPVFRFSELSESSFDRLAIFAPYVDDPWLDYHTYALYGDGRYLEKDHMQIGSFACRAQLRMAELASFTSDELIRRMRERTLKERPAHKARRCGTAMRQLPQTSFMVARNGKTHSARWIHGVESIRSDSFLPPFFQRVKQRIHGLFRNPVADPANTASLRSIMEAFALCHADDARVEFSVAPDTGEPFDIKVRDAFGEPRSCVERAVAGQRFTPVPRGKRACVPRVVVGDSVMAGPYKSTSLSVVGLLEIHSSEPAEVYSASERYGRTPIRIKLWPLNREHSLSVKALDDGATQTIRARLSAGERHTREVVFD